MPEATNLLHDLRGGVVAEDCRNRRFPHPALGRFAASHSRRLTVN